MDFVEVVRSRRMTRSFSSESVHPETIDLAVDLATRAPSAGKTQGWHVIALEGESLFHFWSVVFPEDQRASFKWPGLFDAPLVTLWFADPQAYVERYSEPDKSHTGLGAGVEAWPTPYWTIDASMALGTFLLAIENAGLGALLFAVFNNRDALMTELGIPSHLELLGAVAVGYSTQGTQQPGVSASRKRRSPAQIIHRNRW